ncbi:MAG: hydrogenase maturation protease [Chloroflexi bacterium]|nr:hydrogenase maturation protease [Chloroflexota bacterium]
MTTSNARTTPKVLVIGLGNPILMDDGVGVLTAEHVRNVLPADSGIDVIELSVGGITLMEQMVGYDRVIIIDALWTDPTLTGQVVVFDAGDLTETLNTRSTHDSDLPTALYVGRALGADLPPDDAIQIVAVTANHVLDFGDQPTEVVRAAIPQACRTVLDLIGEATQMVPAP